jgi:orotidine 5'-phosphate decarboxylase subfamily 2
MNFNEKLRRIQRKNDSLLCIGLDTEVSRVPKSLLRRKDPQYEFNRAIIDATRDLVCAYKLNIAFYESAGEHGWRTVHRTLGHIGRGIVTVGDGKRGDIQSSAEKQAELLCDDWKFDASTVNPYMGWDAVEPFTRRREQCAFVLAVTSNAGSKDFQQLKVGGRPLYERVILAAAKWNGRKNIGLVVGATRAAELRRVRSLVPEMPLLIPGIGAQKGDLRATVRYGCDARGELALINVGRSIIYASAGDDFAARAREAAVRYRDEINSFREEFFGKAGHRPRGGRR